MRAQDELSTTVVKEASPFASSSAIKLDDLLTDSDAEDSGDDADVLSDAADPAYMKEMMRELKQDGIVAFVTKRRHMSPRDMLALFGIDLPDEMPDGLEPFHVLKMVFGRIMSKREKRSDLNTVEDVLKLLKESNRILVLTGAGVSTSCGIPDFRSEHGIYAKIRDQSNGLLNDPQEMFDIDFFRENPSIFYSFAHELYPSNFRPSATHRFIRQLEDRGKLLRNYSQNIDTLEQFAGITRVLNCHGSFATAVCIKCGHRVPGASIKADIFAQRVPLCSACPPQATELIEGPPAKKRKVSKRPWEEAEDEDDGDGLPPNEWLNKSVIKPSITFFGEKLDDKFGELLLKDRTEVDLLLVIGTSLKVAPVSDVTSHIPHSIPQILINRDPVPHAGFDVCLLGDCDEIVRWLVHRLEWSPLDDPPILPSLGPERIAESHYWAFEGANRGHRSLTKLYDRAN